MINKVHFGKRIAKLRKEHKITQVELAERLGVTSQAVSKWECGAALPDVELLLELSHLYDTSINDMLEEENIFEKIANRPYEYNGIAYFIPNKEHPWNKEWARRLVEEKWVETNWKHFPQGNKVYEDVISRALKVGGTILEIGAGPGGGFATGILQVDPDATVIINDYSPTVVQEWKRFLDKELDSPNISYAVFSFCDMPLKDNSIDVITDCAGIANVENGTEAQALKEVYRVLKPGGLFITTTGFVTKETYDALPEHAQTVLKEKKPFIFDDLYEATVLAGFKKIDSVIDREWYTDDDESGVATLAKSLHVNVKFTSYVRFCEKSRAELICK